jgi:catechol 2,3-dioxygenase-like lactoylglutathione lyase family enzyme
VKLLRAATLTVADPEGSARRYAEWFGYRILERGHVDVRLAASWAAPRVAGRRFVVLEPASRAPVLLRFIEGDAPAAFRPLRTYGWAALEICVEDVLTVDERLRGSPFEIIGPPREIEGLPSIFPIQVMGPDREIVYLTQIRGDLPSYDLPRAASPIDELFILVLACSDLDASLAWFERHARLSLGRRMRIVYTMLAKSFDLPVSDPHEIATLVHGRDVFLELDQYPAAATPRAAPAGDLPPGISLATLAHPEFGVLPGPWIVPPARRHGTIYGGRLAGTLRAPDGTLLEMVESD